MTALAIVAVAAAGTTPEQIHIAFAGTDSAGNANGMTVSWATMAATATSTVHYGLSPDALTMTATGTALSYLEVRRAAVCRVSACYRQLLLLLLRAVTACGRREREARSAGHAPIPLVPVRPAALPPLCVRVFTCGAPLCSRHSTTTLR